MFLKLTNGAYPIVFLDAEGHESPLVYCGDESRRAGITFDIRGEEIHISRSLDNGSPIPTGAVLHGQLLFNPEAGTIHAISNRSAWKTWEEVIEELDAVNDFNEFDRFESEDDNYDDDFDNEEEDRNEPAITSPGIRRLPHAVVTPISIFNSASIRLSPEMINEADGNCYFLRAGLDTGTPSLGTPSYLLDIPHGMTTPKVLLTPVGLYDDQTFAFSNAAFWLLNPYRRSNLSAPMKAKTGTGDFRNCFCAFGRDKVDNPQCHHPVAYQFARFLETDNQAGGKTASKSSVRRVESEHVPPHGWF